MAVVSSLASLFDRLSDALDRRRERRALLKLDERMLHDIGASRADVEAEVGKPWWRE